jgi:ribosomal protein S18 acetylase RimI-like enzyme
VNIEVINEENATVVDALAFQASIFYEKLGFKTVGTIPAFEQSPERFYMMKQY